MSRRSRMNMGSEIQDEASSSPEMENIRGNNRGQRNRPTTNRRDKGSRRERRKQEKKRQKEKQKETRRRERGPAAQERGRSKKNDRESKRKQRELEGRRKNQIKRDFVDREDIRKLQRQRDIIAEYDDLNSYNDVLRVLRRLFSRCSEVLFNITTYDILYTDIPEEEPDAGAAAGAGEADAGAGAGMNEDLHEVMGLIFDYIILGDKKFSAYLKIMD
jgi:cobalamin biosynthesis protein CobT